MKSFISQCIKHRYVLALLAFTTWLFFFHLDYNTLGSWDEAWYGSIARDMIKSGDWMRMTFNGQPYYDHPPFGFWMIALSYTIFGISEFSTRLPSVLTGIGGVLLVYALCAEFLKKKEIGFVAGIILSTCVWYTIRVRSGNLDSAFLFFYVATIFTALKATKSFRWIILTGLAFGALVMTKTLAGVSAILVILWLIVPYLFSSRKNIFYALVGILGFFLLTYPWYSYHLEHVSGFYQRHFIEIGSRNKSFSLETLTHLQWELPMFYLHMGVRKWYYVWFVGFGAACIQMLFAVFMYFRQKEKKRLEYLKMFHVISALIGWNIVILYPFLTTDLTQIWHLIPVYAPLAVLTAHGVHAVSELGLWIVSKFPNKQIVQFVNKYHLREIGYICVFLCLAFVQVKVFYHEVFPANRYVVDEVDIYKKTQQFGMTVYSDRDYIPVAVYYSERPVKEYARQATAVQTIQTFIDTGERKSVMVVQNSAVAEYKKTGMPLEVVSSNNSFSIISRK